MTGESSPKRSRKWPKKKKGLQKSGNLVIKRSTKFLKLQKRLTIFEDTEKDQNISCKADTKKLAQSLVRLVQSLVYQHGRASRVVDGSFPYWA